MPRGTGYTRSCCQMPLLSESCIFHEGINHICCPAIEVRDLWSGHPATCRCSPAKLAKSILFLYAACMMRVRCDLFTSSICLRWHVLTTHFP